MHIYQGNSSQNLFHNLSEPRSQFQEGVSSLTFPALLPLHVHTPYVVLMLNCSSHAPPCPSRPEVFSLHTLVYAALSSWDTFSCFASHNPIYPTKPTSKASPSQSHPWPLRDEMYPLWTPTWYLTMCVHTCLPYQPLRSLGHGL